MIHFLRDEHNENIITVEIYVNEHAGANAATRYVEIKPSVDITAFTITYEKLKTDADKIVFGTAINEINTIGGRWEDRVQHEEGSDADTMVMELFQSVAEHFNLEYVVD
jgi:hypothetical protein